jgi:hypothetical protein
MRPAGSNDGPAEVLIVGQVLADFPMMPEGIHDSPQAPTVGLIADGPNNLGSRSDSFFANRVRIFYDHNRS